MAQTKRDVIEKLLRERVLILDGAMGTMIQARGLSREHFHAGSYADHDHELQGNNELICLTQPDVIRDIHDAYLAAGSDIIETNTFNSNAISQSDYGMSHLTGELNLAAVRLARQACDEWTKKTPHKPRFVAGAVGPTNKQLSMSPDVNDPAYRVVTFDRMKDVYVEQVRVLIDAGVGPAVGRDDLRYVGGEGGVVRDLRGVRREGLRTADHDQRHDQRSERAHAVRPIGRCVLPLGRARAATDGRPQLRVRRARHAPLRRRAVELRTHVRGGVPERGLAERVRRIRRATRRHGVASARVRRMRDW